MLPEPTCQSCDLDQRRQGCVASGHNAHAPDAAGMMELYRVGPRYIFVPEFLRRSQGGRMLRDRAGCSAEGGGRGVPRASAPAGGENEGGARADRRVKPKRKNCSRRIEENHEVAL